MMTDADINEMMDECPERACTSCGDEEDVGQMGLCEDCHVDTLADEFQESMRRMLEPD